MIIPIVILLVLVAWLVLRDIRHGRKLSNIEAATGARGAPPAATHDDVPHQERST